ncbi:hypothetical protein STEG23_021911, partial [Scotinomys teguina]
SHCETMKVMLNSVWGTMNPHSAVAARSAFSLQDLNHSVPLSSLSLLTLIVPMWLQDGCAILSTNAVPVLGDSRNQELFVPFFKMKHLRQREMERGREGKRKKEKREEEKEREGGKEKQRDRERKKEEKEMEWDEGMIPSQNTALHCQVTW